MTQLSPPMLRISSSVASGYLASIFLVAMRYLSRSRSRAENDLTAEYNEWMWLSGIEPYSVKMV